GASGEEDELIEVVAAHYLNAYEAMPRAEDAEEMRSKSRERLVLAGERAASLASPIDAARYFERASALTDDAIIRAQLVERAGAMAMVGERFEEARAHLEGALASFEELGRARDAA